MAKEPGGNLKEELDKKIWEYVDRFDENFPLFQMPTMTNEEMLKIVNECLESGKPYECETSDDPRVHY